MNDKVRGEIGSPEEMSNEEQFKLFSRGIVAETMFAVDCVMDERERLILASGILDEFDDNDDDDIIVPVQRVIHPLDISRLALDDKRIKKMIMNDAVLKLIDGLGGR